MHTANRGKQILRRILISCPTVHEIRRPTFFAP
jgi:hypothetical protein